MFYVLKAFILQEFRRVSPGYSYHSLKSSNSSACLSENSPRRVSPSGSSVSPQESYQFKKGSPSHFAQITKENFNSKLADFISSRITLEDFCAFFEDLIENASRLNQAQAQKILNIFCESWQPLEVPKKTIRSSSEASFEGIDLESMTSELARKIAKKNAQRETVLKKLRHHAGFCENLGLLITIARNQLDLEKQYSNEPLFQRFYSHRAFHKHLTADIKKCFDANIRPSRALSITWGWAGELNTKELKKANMSANNSQRGNIGQSPGQVTRF